MTEITVRKVAFEFPDDVPVIGNPAEISQSLGMVGFSFTLPHLEPYLIRTMRTAVRDVEDSRLIEDMKHFSSQEGFHFQNHARINDLVCSKLRPETAQEMRQIESEMEADYQRFSKEHSLKWNLAYAEGFEAMTLVMALISFEKGFEGWDQRWANLYEWHLAEEVEHRTVCFDAYDTLYGDYFYRVRWGYWAQMHFMGYVERFTKCVAQDFEAEYGPYRRPASSMKQFRLWLNGFMPWYNPGKINISEGIQDIWTKYDMLASR